MTGQIKLTYAGRDCAEKDVTIITTGSVETVTAAFAFDAEWDGFARTAIFAAGGTVKRVVLDDVNACVVPWEVLTNCKHLAIGVVGTSGNRVLPSVPVTVRIAEGIYTDGTAPEDPTPDVYAQLLALAEETKQIAQSVRDDADAGKFKGDKGVTGYTPVKGVDYWTPTEAAEMDAAKTAAINAADRANEASDTALYAASMADEAASSASISAQNADAAAGEARAKAAELQAKADAGDFNGQDGYTPIRGTDYWTDADKAAINADIAAQLAGKVDKIDGKGLSSNDYTDADKKTVASARNTSQHIDTVTVAEEIRSIQRSGLNLKGLRVYGQNPDNPISAPYVRFSTANGSVDIWCSSYKYFICDVTCVNGLYYVELYTNSNVPTSTMKSDKVLGYNAIKTIQTIGSAPITSITILGGAGKNLTVGTTFEIYGTEA